MKPNIHHLINWETDPSACCCGSYTESPEIRVQGPKEREAKWAVHTNTVTESKCPKEGH